VQNDGEATVAAPGKDELRSLEKAVVLGLAGI